MRLPVRAPQCLIEDRKSICPFFFIFQFTTVSSTHDRLYLIGKDESISSFWKYLTSIDRRRHGSCSVTYMRTASQWGLLKMSWLKFTRERGILTHRHFQSCQEELYICFRVSFPSLAQGRVDARDLQTGPYG